MSWEDTMRLIERKFAVHNERMSKIVNARDTRTEPLTGRLRPGDSIIFSTGQSITAEPNEPVEYRIERKT